MENLLEVKNLAVGFYEGEQISTVLNRISFSIGRGEIVGIVGESGSGKSMTALSMMRLLSDDAVILDGSIEFEGRDLLKLPAKEMRQLQGNEISMIFQEPMTSLNPVIKVGRQVGEALKLHTDMKKDEIKACVIEALKSAGLPDAQKLYDKYPYELSGGMRQRVMIAMATVCHPKLLIADEPTTALDVTVQAQILRLLKRFHENTGTSILFISHDLNVIQALCQRIIVTYKGDIVETGEAKAVLAHPQHEYTKTLVASIPMNEDCGQQDDAVLDISGLNVYYEERRGLSALSKHRRHILKDISFTAYKGEILGIVGESGCGKSTLAKTIVGLNKNYTGKILSSCKKPQMVFQDPFSSLNPSKKLGWLLEEPLKLQGVRDKKKRGQIADQLLNEIGLDPSYKKRYPHELSGGQRQRISIGMALLTGAKLIVADEPVSALDVTVQSQILNLLLDIHRKAHTTMLFISHDLDVVRHMCTRVIVMYLGEIVEMADVADIYDAPKHPYTRLLLSAVDAGRRTDINDKDSGEALAVRRSGCPFYARCPYRKKKCRTQKPEPKDIGENSIHLVTCHLYMDEAVNNTEHEGSSPEEM